MKDAITVIDATDEFIDFTDSDPGGPGQGKGMMTLAKGTRKLYRMGTPDAICTLSEEDLVTLFGPEWRTLGVEVPRTPEPEKDMVDKPAHYSRYGVETIDALRGTMSADEFNGFLKGNAIKYLTRAGAKDALDQDLNKVIWYASFLYLANGGTVEQFKRTCDYMVGRFSK